MIRRIGFLLLIALFLPSTLWAQEKKKKTTFVRKVLNFIDTMAVSSIDTSYIKVPEKPWAVVLRNNFNQAFIDLRSDVNVVDDQIMTVRMLSSTPLKWSVGAWIGYRGYGLGYTQDVVGRDGADFTANILTGIAKNFIVGAMGGSYGLNLRIRTYTLGKSELTAWSKMENGKLVDATMEIKEPLSVRSVFADGYYMFNGKHFSYSAGYDQSAIQVRSAGSLVAGLMYHYSRVEFGEEANAELLKIMSDVGKMKVWQGSVGAGYAYNWVPSKRLMINVMFVPMFTFYNRVKVYYAENDETDMTKNRVVGNVDARLSITYNWKYHYLNAYGHYNRFRYSNNNGGKVRLGDWYAYLSYGVRF